VQNRRWVEIEADLAKLNNRKLYTFFLDKQGRCLDKLELIEQSMDAAVDLYDLSKPVPGSSPGSPLGLTAGAESADQAQSR
jgi:hypothetical protein